MLKHTDMKILSGTKDFLPGDAQQKRILETALATQFTRWGYQEIVTPTLEYLKTLAPGLGAAMSEQMFMFLDRTNQLLALRPEMTTPIARVVATRLTASSLPLRLFYLTNAFRYEEAQAGRQCEFYQAGVELMGVQAPAADAEVISLAVAAARIAGLDKFQLGLGQVDFINGIMNESGLTESLRQQVKLCLINRNLVGLDEILSQSGLSPATRQVLAQLPLLTGDYKLLSRARQLTDNRLSRAAIDNLEQIFELLTAYDVQRYVTFDLSIIRDFDYYTGLVFEGYTPGLGFPFCGGGRYDRLLAEFGFDCPATGFAMGLERLLLAQQRQGIKQVIEDRDLYVAWESGCLLEAIAAAARLRAQGLTVELAPAAESQQTAEQNRQVRGFRELLYVQHDA